MVCSNPEFPVYIKGSEKLVYTLQKELNTEIRLEGYDNSIRTNLIKLTLETTESEQSYIWTNILKLIKKFVETIDKITMLPSYDSNIISEVITISLEKTLGAIERHFHRIEKREELSTPFRSFRSISTENNYLDMTAVVGCSSVVEYNKRKFTCIKRFVNLIRKPIVDYIGSDMVFPILKLIDRQISEISNLEIKQLSIVLNLENGSKEELINFLRNKLLNPGLPYNEAKQEIENRKLTIEDSTEEQEVEHSTLDYNSVRTSNRELETTENSIDIEHQVQSDMPVAIHNDLETETNSRIETDVKLAQEIMENEQDLGLLKGQFENLRHSLLEIQNSLSQTTTHSSDNKNNDLETETNSRIETDIKLARELMENEQDLGILKGQFEDLRLSLLGIQKSLTQTNTHSSDNKNNILETDIRITQEILQSKREIGLLKGQLEYLKQNLLGIKNSQVETSTSSLDSRGKEYEDFIVFLFLQELILYFENIETTEPTIWDKEIFKSDQNKLLLKVTALEGKMATSSLVQIPVCANSMCSYREHAGYIIDDKHYIPKKYCKQKKSIFCEESKKVELCKNFICDVKETKVHKTEILNFGDTVFIYPMKTIYLLNLTFFPNYSYMIRFEKNISFMHNNTEYKIVGNQIINDIEVTSYPKYEEYNLNLWEKIVTYKDHILIVGSSIGTLLGAISLGFFLKTKYFKNNENERTVRVNNTRVTFSRPSER